MHWIRQRGAVLLGLSLLSLTVAILQGGRILTLAAYSLIGIGSAALLIALTGITGMRVIYYPPTSRAQIGDHIEERIHLRRISIVPSAGLLLRARSTLPGHRGSQLLASILPGASRDIVIRTRCLRRGEYSVGQVSLEAADPFGFFSFRRDYTEGGTILILPAIYPLADSISLTGALPGGDALHRRSQQVTANAVSIRDYQTGDSFNRIHWLSTARKGRMISREFELDPIADVYLVLDLERSQHHDAGEGQVAESHSTLIYPSTEEYTITAAASLVEELGKKGRSVGLICYPEGREQVMADRGERQRMKLLEMLALLRAQSTVTLRDVLSFERESIPRGAMLVVISPTTRQDWLVELDYYRSRGIEVILLLLDTRSFGGRPGTERLSELAERLAIPHRVIQRVEEGLPDFFRSELP